MLQFYQTCHCFQITSIGTRSKAFSRSTKAIHRSLFFTRCLSWSCLSMNTTSVVPLPGVNPNCISSICRVCLSRASITRSNTFIACSSSCIRSTLQSIPFALVHLDHVASVPIIWHLTLFHNRDAKISQPSNAIFTRSFKQFSSYPCGSWSQIAFNFCNCQPDFLL